MTQILRAKSEDASRLTEIAFAAKRHWGYPERWIQNWKDVLTIQPESIVGFETYVAYENEQAVGFYALASQPGKMSLEHFWVLPKFMGKGIGRALFNHAVQRAKALGFESFVIESDPNAEGFYQRMGAHPAGVNLSELDGQRRVLSVFIMNCAPHHNRARAADGGRL